MKRYRDEFDDEIGEIISPVFFYRGKVIFHGNKLIIKIRLWNSFKGDVFYQA